MKKPNRNKSISSVSSSTITNTNIIPIAQTSDLEFFSSYSHEQVHIYDKHCSSISSICQIAYCTSDGIIICVPQTYQHQSLSSSQNISSTLSSMIIARISYPFESIDQTNSISLNSSSYLFFEKIKNHYLINLYEAYKHRPTSLSSFDRLLCYDTIQYKGFRQCLFSPFNIKLNQGQSILATITCAHEVFIYEIISSSKRFFLSQSSNLKIDLTKHLFENINQYEYILNDSDCENNYRLLYFHLTSNILWNKTGTLFFQLQYSGHIIIWKFNEFNLFNEHLLKIIDTKISKPLTMIWNDECQILCIIGIENQRVFIKVDQMKLFNINNNDNDYMNTEHAQLIKINEKKLILIESKMNYCLIYSIIMDENQSSSYDCNQIDCRVFPTSIIGLQQQQQQQDLLSLNCISILVGCEDGTMHSLIISYESSIINIDTKLIASGNIKSCSRKPLYLRHFNLSSNEFLLARIFYSPIVAPNVKFGFVLCTLHRWLYDNTISLDKIIENFLLRISIPLWHSSDELAIILNEIKHNPTYHYQIKKNTNENFLFLQRLCRLYTFLNNTKQLQLYENQLLQKYRQQLCEILTLLFSNMINKLSSIELLIYKICCKNEELSSSDLLMCPICNTLLTITINDLLFSTCSNKHSWPRCCRTLLPLSFESVQTCSLCDRTITLIDINDKNYINFVQYKDKELNFLFSSICTYCM